MPFAWGLWTTTSDAGSYDAVLSLGMLRNEKRFNVALNRAQALTIVVGNPFILAEEPNWRTLLEYAVENDAYAGCPCPPSLDTRSRLYLLLRKGRQWDSTALEELSLANLGDGWRNMM